jgi:hypothetical protein
MAGVVKSQRGRIFRSTGPQFINHGYKGRDERTDSQKLL